MIRVEVGPMIRCDIVTYSGVNFSGKHGRMRIFPTGSQQGTLDGSKIGSLILRAPPGVRIIFMSHVGDDWEEYPWRAIEISNEKSIQSAKSVRLRGVRIPDIDYLDRFDAKLTNPSGSSTYPIATSLEAGDGWSYGRQQDGGLRGNVQAIRVEKMGVTVPPPLVAKDLLALAERILAEPKEDLRTTVVEALVEQLVRAGMEEAPAREMADTV